MKFIVFKLVGTDYDKIVSEVSSLLDDAQYYEKMSQAVNPYGDRKACERIAQYIQTLSVLRLLGGIVDEVDADWASENLFMSKERPTART